MTDKACNLEAPFFVFSRTGINSFQQFTDCASAFSWGDHCWEISSKSGEKRSESLGALHCSHYLLRDWEAAPSQWDNAVPICRLRKRIKRERIRPSKGSLQRIKRKRRRRSSCCCLVRHNSWYHLKPFLTYVRKCRCRRMWKKYFLQTNWNAVW